MTWFLIILNIAGGTPAFIEMPTEDACQAAVEATWSDGPGQARAWCAPAGEWPEYAE